MTNFLHLKAYAITNLDTQLFLIIEFQLPQEKWGIVENSNPFLSLGGILQKHFETHRDSNLSITLYTTVCHMFFSLPAISANSTHQMWGIFPHTKQFSNSLQTQAGYPAIQFNSATIYLDTTIRSHRVKGSDPEDCPYFRGQSEVQFDTYWLWIRVPTSLPHD